MRIDSDWYDVHLPVTTNDPERNLIAAIIIRALVDASINLPVREEYNLAVQARRWFRSNDDTPFSFLWCCQMLSIEATQVLKLVSRAKDEGVWNVIPDWSSNSRVALMRKMNMV